MNTLKQFLHFYHILSVFLKYRIDTILEEAGIPHRLHLLRLFFPQHWFKKNNLERGKALRLSLEELGPIFIKFGQVLSTRKDLIPEDITDELSLLQDSAPPFPFQISEQLIEKRFKKPVLDVFKTFDSIPFAAASIAQIHSATLKNDETVIVKILRPNIKAIIQKDIQLMELIASLLHFFFKESRRFRPKEIIAEFKMTLNDELDLLREAASASQLRRNFENSHLLYVPKIYWAYCKQDILVMERISGIPIGNINLLKKNNVNLKILAERGVEIFFTQVFRDSFFHADMHPGNIFINIDNPEKPQYIAVDFGIMGMLSPEDQNYLAENFLAFFKRDYRRVAELHVESGWVPKDTRIEAFESAIRTVCEPIFEQPLGNISVAETLIKLFQTAGRFNMPIQPQLILLQKTLLSVEGLGRQLYPELDLWATAKPFLEKWMKDRVSFRSFYEKIKKQFPKWLAMITSPPNKVN